uniref:BAR domain-containing protein n=1 Tax=Panagrellus redivivus TaxID=6233 RepID=A0A7E4VZU7_PANRE
MSGGGGIRKLFGKMGGNVEVTKMSPDFVKSCEHVDQYKEAVDQLADRFEGAIQQNPAVLQTGSIECQPGENPHEKTAASLGIFMTYFGGDKANQVKELIEENKKLAAVERSSQVTARRAIRHMRRFYITEYKAIKDERDKLDKAREHMDTMKHEVKQAKTTEQIEKKAVLYEEAVGAFDAQAAKVIEIIGTLPALQKTHVNDVHEYFENLSQFHGKMAHSIAKREIA